MDFYKKLTEFFGKPKEERIKETPEEACPVCWGYQVYDDKIKVVFKDGQVDANNHRFKYMRIQKLLKEKIEGFRLKKGEFHTCPTCSKQKENFSRKNQL